MNWTKIKIGIINVLLAIITISILVMLIGMVYGNIQKDTAEFLSLTGLCGALISGFFFELKLLHDKDSKKGAK